MEDKKDRKDGLIFIISGPSGSGKTTLLKEVLLNKDLRNKLVKSVSVTTRPKRSGERQGRDYFFVKPQEFRRLKRTKKILEWTEYLGYYYGTKREFIEDRLKRGKHLALCLDLRGALKLKKFYPREAVTIFISPPSLKELSKRIAGRCSKTKQEEINKRVELAAVELKNARKYDYVLENRNFAQATSRLTGIILKETGVKPRARCD